MMEETSAAPTGAQPFTCQHPGSQEEVFCIGCHQRVCANCVKAHLRQVVVPPEERFPAVTYPTPCAGRITYVRRALLPVSVPPPTGTMWTYFVQAADGGPVKIGRSRNVRQRLDELQISHPFELRLVAVFDGAADGHSEAGYHLRFKHGWLRGEWFALTDDLLNFITISRTA